MDNKLDVKNGTKNPNIVMIIFLFILSMAGLVDATYLTIKHYSHSRVNCSIFEGCELVTTSDYSVLFGIPVALLGVIYYLTFFILALCYLKYKRKYFIKKLFFISTIGFLASIWFMYVQFFIISAFCLYCIISALLSTTLFISSIILMLKYDNHRSREDIINNNTKYNDTTN